MLRLKNVSEMPAGSKTGSSAQRSLGYVLKMALLPRLPHRLQLHKPALGELVLAAITYMQFVINRIEHNIIK